MTTSQAPDVPRSLQHRPFTPRDLLDQVMVRDLAVSPDGRTVYYSRRTIEDGRYADRIWTVPVAGGSPRCISGDRSGERFPRPSSDGSSVLFVSTTDGGARLGLMTPDGEVRRPPAPGLVGVQGVGWLPDGRIVALAPSGVDRFIVGDATDPIARHIRTPFWRRDGIGVRDQHTAAWLVDPGRETAERITDATFDVLQVALGPDGDLLVVAERPDIPGAPVLPHVYRLSLDRGSLELLAGLPGSVLAVGWHAAGGLAMLGREGPGAPDAEQVGLYLDAPGGAVRLGVDLDGPVWNTASCDIAGSPQPASPPLWLDASSILALVTDGPEVVPYRFGTDGSCDRLVDGDVLCTAVAAGDGVIVGIAAVDGGASDVFRIRDRTLHRLTTNGADWHQPFRRPSTRRVVEHPLGLKIDAWWLPADVPRPGPTVLQIHGGPTMTHVSTPSLEMTALRDAGINVVWANPRGSHGYGPDFAADDATAYGEPAAIDLLAVIDDAIAAGLADPARIGLLGHSYGGYMVLWLLAQHPERFAAGVAGSPVSDLISKIASSDTHASDQWIGMRLPEDAGRFLEKSPYRQIHHSRAPLLLVQPDDDLRCPPGQSELIFHILAAHGTPVEMVRYPGESHGMPNWGRPDRRVDRLDRIVDWFTLHLDVAPSAEQMR